MAKQKLAITYALGSIKKNLSKKVGSHMEICISLAHTIHLEREMQLAKVIVRVDLIVFPSRLGAVKTARAK